MNIILVAEDDVVILETFTEVIESFCGASVIPTKNCQEAVDAAWTNPDICFAVLDHVMPIMTGVEAYRHIRLLRKDMIIILLSGDISSITDAKLREDPLLYIISKPFNVPYMIKLFKKLLRRCSWDGVN